MADKTTFTGRVQRFSDDNLITNKRISGARTVTEFSGIQKITVAPGSANIGIKPAGLTTIRTVYMETDRKINIETTGVRTASLNLHDNGILLLFNASLSNIKVSNRTATWIAHPTYDLSG